MQLSKLSCYQHPGGGVLTRKRDIAQALNHHFVTVGPKLSSKIESRQDDDPVGHFKSQTNDIVFTPVDSATVLKAIKSLKNGKSPGPDKVSTMLVKDAAELICKPLVMIYNSSMESGVFPDFWKLARVTPIFKSGNKSDANNYRPISIISVFARIFEKIVHDQLYNFLSTNNILTPSQSAFRKLHSTITSLINCTDNWYRNIDKKQLNLSLFLDLKKAFDTVDHQIMVKKLNAIGVRGIAGDWFASCLSNRKQYCSLGDQKSSESFVTCGIPQGSCLGPLLFIIYLNDFEDCLVHSKAGMYADDTHVTLTSDSLAELFESAREEMMNISEWMRINKLSINPQKTEYMIIGHPRRTNKILSHEPLMLNGAEIKHVKETKSLGIIVDEGLNWNEQHKKVKGKVSGGLWSLKKLMKIVPQSQLVNIYHALVESHLRYANVVWGSLSNTKLEALQRLQNRAHSIIERAKIKDQWSGDWLTVEQLINFDRSVMTYKMMNKICPESLWDTYKTRNMYSSYRTRNCTDIQLPRYNLEYSKKSFHYSGLKAWNEIPNTIRELSTLQQFKKHLKIHLRS